MLKSLNYFQAKYYFYLTFGLEDPDYIFYNFIIILIIFLYLELTIILIQTWIIPVYLSIISLPGEALVETDL